MAHSWGCVLMFIIELRFISSLCTLVNENEHNQLYIPATLAVRNSSYSPQDDGMK